MAGEGVFPKADGDVYYSSDLNNVNSGIINLLSNAVMKNYGMFRSAKPALEFSEDFVEDVATTSTNLTHKTAQYEYVGSASAGAFVLETPTLKFDSNVTKLQGAVFYEVFEYYDDFAGGTIDSALWLTSTNCTQTTDSHIDIANSGQLISKDITSEGVILRVSGIFTATVTGPDNSRNITFRLTDGTNDENVVVSNSYDNGDGYNTAGMTDYWTAEFYFDWDASEVRYNTRIYKNNYDVNGATYGTKTVINESGYLDFSAWASMKLEIESGANSTTGDLTEVKWLKTNPSSTITFSCSSNNGTTYLENLNGAPAQLSTVSDEVKLKLNGTMSGNEVIGIKGYHVKKLG